jgi:hypothetical protein
VNVSEKFKHLDFFKKKVTKLDLSYWKY